LPWGARLGNVSAGDGYRYRGRGLIQITGRSNYEQASARVYGDARLITTPDLLTLAEGASLTACWFYSSRNLVSLTDVEAITHGVNGGENGLAARQAETDKLLNFVTN
jgi:putative chitinase